MNGTNTRETRERYEERRGRREEGEKRGGRRRNETRHPEPALPAPAQPGALPQFLGRHAAAAAPAPTATAPFLGVGEIANLVRQEMISALKELKEAAAAPPAPKEKVVWDVLRSNKEEMRSILRELGFLGF